MIENIKWIMEKLVYMAKEELEHNEKNICTKEFGEVIDMIEDLEKTLYYCHVIKDMEEKDESVVDHILSHPE